MSEIESLVARARKYLRSAELLLNLIFTKTLQVVERSQGFISLTAEY